MKMIVLTAVLLFSIAVSSCENQQKGNATTDKETPASLPAESEETMDRESPENKIGAEEQHRIQELVGFDGTIEEYIQWTDSLGDYLVLTSKKEIYWTSSDFGENDLQNAELSCHCYLKKAGDEKYARIWKIQDYSKACEVDAVARFKRNVLQHTDLDNDGIAEIWVMYYIACKGDVSPSILKLILYEGTEKHKMTGETKVNIGSGTFVGGKITSEGTFKEQPVFLEFARALWEKNCAEI
jgi:hypothetical protein